MSSDTFSLLTTLIATGGAIAGGIIGSFLTHKHARELDEQKRLAEKEEEKQFNAKIRNVVRYELEFISDTLKEIQGGKIAKRALLSPVLEMERVYPKMSLERRASAFNPDVLSQVESSYQVFTSYSIAFRELYSKEREKYFEGRGEKNEPFLSIPPDADANIIQNLALDLDTGGLNKMVDYAIQLIDKNATSFKESPFKPGT